MKLTVTGGTAGRNLLRERQRRDRAAAQLLRMQYPQFASLRFDFKFSDEGAPAPAPQLMEMHPPARAYFLFACPYADCDGEFDLSTNIETMATGSDGECKGHLRCGGQRARDKNGRAPCQVTLEFAIAAKYL